MTTKKITEALASAAKSHKLPEFYKDDLDVDFNELPRYLERGLSVIWLLRSCGTVMVPVGVGADPVFITHWLWSNHGQDVVAFHVTKDGVEKIDYETAEQLISREPAQLSTLLSAKEVREAVDSVLDRGIELKIWGIFDNVKAGQFQNLDEWQMYFANSSQRMMANFIGKAKRLIKIKPVS